MNIVRMLAAFACMLGIVLAFKNILKVSAGEGTLLSASLIVLALFLGGKAGSFAYGMYVLLAVSAAGYLLTIVSVIREGKGALSFFCSPYLVILFLIFCYCLIAYFHDFIQHIDEFHHWALAVKYMLETGLPADHSVLFGTVHPYGTSLFYLFFQKFTGYNEQNMYVAATLLMWIGFLLPFSGYERKDWKKAAIYALIVFFGSYSLYLYGMKNLYVDVAVGSWAGGLAGWWRNREKKKTDCLVLGSGLLMICFFKWMAGPLIALFALLFVIAHTCFIEKKMLSDPEKQKKALRIGLAAAFVLAAVLGIFLVLLLKAPNTMELLNGFFGGTVTKTRITDTVGAFIASVFGRPLANKSSLKIAFVPFLIALTVLMKLIADLFQQKREFAVYLTYMVCTVGAFLGILLFAYLFMFTEEESTRIASGPRYLTLYVLLILVPVLSWLLQRGKSSHPKAPGYLASGILLMFVSGLNEDYIPNATALYPSEISGYEQITNTGEQANRIQKVLTDTDKVYLLDQQGKGEYARTAALYYLEEQVSDYIVEPWKFTENGNMTRLVEEESPTIEAFPQLLADGGYTYLWIYQADSYLKSTLPQLFVCEDGIGSGRLYRILYEGGAAVGLDQVNY